jgi:galactose oxidase
MRMLPHLAAGGVLALAAHSSFAVTPGEVSNLRFISRDNLTWDSTPGATRYNLYRGYLRQLSASFYGTAVEPEVPLTSAYDPVKPPAGEAFFYLVTGMGDAEGMLGFGRAGAVRPNRFPWPGFGVAGRWQPLIAWPGPAVHLMVLRTGKVLSWEGVPAPSVTWLWDPATGGFTTQSLSTNIFCAGHTQLPDGRILVTGGNTEIGGFGPNTSWTYTPGAASPWVRGPDMRNGRYYPSNVTLGDGRVLVFGGQRQDGQINEQVEAYVEDTSGTRFDLLPGGTWPLQNYPMLFLLPSGKIFHAGPEIYTKTFDPVVQLWTNVDQSNYGSRTSGTAVMLPPGASRFLIAGGRTSGDHHAAATASAEVIDLNDAIPNWRTIAPMRFARLYQNSVILPDGKVLVVGGGYNDDVPVYPSEMFDPLTETWSVMASQRSFRLYHSSAVLLPDATVLSAGSNFNNTAEIYRPGYLFRGARPTISNAPATIRYGHAFSVGTATPSSIRSVVLIRPGASTHAFTQDQRYVPLTFSAGSNNLTANPPANANLAPPGHYMLFILDALGVPSLAAWVELRN